MAPASSSWLDLPADDPFGLHVLPYGSFRTAATDRPRVGVAVGPHVLDLTAPHLREIAGLTAATVLLSGRSRIRTTSDSPRAK